MRTYCAIEGIHNLLKKSKLNPELCEVPIDVYNEQLVKARYHGIKKQRW